MLICQMNIAKDKYVYTRNYLTKHSDVRKNNFNLKRHICRVTYLCIDVNCLNILDF